MIETQLAQRYLADNEARNGIYLVGWYTSTRWDPSDHRKAAAERRRLEAVIQLLARQADELSTGGVRIAIVVLDARMYG